MALRSRVLHARNDDGGMAQVESAWMPGSVPRWFIRLKTVTHSGCNRAWPTVTVDESSALPLSQTGTEGKLFPNSN